MNISSPTATATSTLTQPTFKEGTSGKGTATFRTRPIDVHESVDRSQYPAIISFFSELTIVMISIYLPYRAFQLGANSFLVGLVGASGSVVYMFAPFFTGRLSDRVGPKRLLVLGSSLLTVLCLAYTMVSNPAVFVGLRLLEGLGWAMIWPPLEALYSVSGTDVRRSMKTFNLAWGVGAMAAPVFGSLLVDWSSVVGTLFFCVSAMLAALLLTLRIEGRPPVHSSPLVRPKEKLEFKATAVLLSFSFVYGLTLTTFSTFFPRYAASLNLEVALWGTVLSAIYAGRLLAFFLSERVMRSLGLMGTMTTFLLVAAAFPLYAILPGPNQYLLILCSLVTGIGFGSVYSATLVSMLSGPAEGRGRSAGLFESSLGLGSFVGPALAGAVASSGLWLTMLLPLVAIGGVLSTGVAFRRKAAGSPRGEPL